MESSFGRINNFFWVLQNSAKRFFKRGKFGLSPVLAGLTIFLSLFFSAIAVAQTVVYTEPFPPGLFNENASGTGVGDGYAPIPYTSALGDRIYYINHHNSPSAAVFGCYDKDTQTQCDDSLLGITWNQPLPDGDPSSPLASSTANSIEEPLIIAGKLYYPVTRFTGNNFSGYTPQDWGLGCYDLNSLVECGYTLLSTNPNNRQVRVGIEGPFLAGGNLYLLDVDMNLHCVDPATPGIECSSFPLDLSQTGTISDLPQIVVDSTVYAGRIGGEVVGNELFLTVNYRGGAGNQNSPSTTGKKVLCINTSSLAKCNGWSGAVGFSSYENNLNVSNYIYYDNNGTTVLGICNRRSNVQSCVAPNGTPITLADVAQNDSLTHGLGKEVRVNDKTYFPSWAKTDIYCFDWASGTQCTNFPKPSPVSNPQNYGLAVDQAGCIWAYGHNNKLWSLDQLTETFPCRSGTFVGSVSKSCPTSDWVTFDVADITASDFASLVVRIWDGTNWVDFDLLGGNPTTIDLSTFGLAQIDPLQYEVNVTFAAGVSAYTTTPIITISNDLPPGQECSYELTITKTANDNEVPWTIGGAGQTFTLDVFNPGIDLPAGSIITVTDTLPNGLVATSASGSGWVCNPPPPAGQDVNCTTTLQTDLTSSTPLPGIIIDVNVTGPPEGDAFVNCAQVYLTGAAGDLILLDEDCVNVPSPPVYDLEISKEQVSFCVEGLGCFYEITITNNGPGIFSGPISVTDQWGLSGVSFLMGEYPWNCTGGPGSPVSCDYNGPPVILDPNGVNSISFLIAVEIPDNMAGEILENCVNIEWPGTGGIDGDTNPENDEACVETIIYDCPPEYDVAIEKTALDSPWLAGEPPDGGGVFEFVVTNIGDDINPQTVDIVVTDVLPPGFTFTAVDGGPDWDCEIYPGIPAPPESFECTYTGGIILSGQVLPTISVQAWGFEPGEYENCAGVSLDGATDVNMENNEDCTLVVINPEEGIDLEIIKELVGSCYEGSVCSFEITITNNGPATFSGPITISDQWGLGDVSFLMGASPWVCGGPGSPVTCNGPSVTLLNGDSTSFLIAMTVPGDLDAEGFENCASIQWPQTGGMSGDNDPTNDESCIEVEFCDCEEHDVVIEKTSTGGAVGFGGWVAGEPGTFTLQVTNLGDSIDPPGETLIVSDDLPPGFVISSVSGGPDWDCSFANGSPSTLTCEYTGPQVQTGQPLPPIVVTATPKEPGRYENCASVELGGATDVDISNNKDCIPVVVERPSGSGYDVAIDKVSDGDSWPAGGTAYFVLRATNIGTTITPPGTTVVVTDTIPTGFTIVSVNGGPNWNCLFSVGTPANLNCTYTGPPVGPGQPFPPIQVVVNVPKRPGDYRNCATVELNGAMDINTTNNNSCTEVNVFVEKGSTDRPVIGGVFTGLDGNTWVNTRQVGDIVAVVVTGVNGEPVDPDDIDIREENDTVGVTVNPNIQVGAITIEGSDGTIVLEADGSRPNGPPGITWPKDGAVNVQNGNLNETFAVPATITSGEHPIGDYDVRFGNAPVDVLAIRNGEIAVTGRGIQMQDSGETGISIAVKDGPRVSGQIPAWSYQLSAQPVTRLNTWAPIFFQCSGLPAREPIAIRFTPESWQRIEPREVSLTCGEASSRIQIGQYQTSREGPQNLPAVIDRTPGR